VASDKPAHTYRFLEEAEADFLEALRFYDERDRAVARRFDRLIKRAIAIIIENPERWPVKDGSHRYVLRHGFPYTIAYVVDGRMVSIIAVAHHSRDPASWRERR
jgi:plasmid stabilization system protein ParE